MATLESRLAKLEASRAQHRPDDQRGVAMKRLCDALFEALPHDPMPVITGNMGVRELSAYQSSMDKIRALAYRIEAGELNEEDRMLLDGLPQDDPALDMTPVEFIATMISGLDKLY